MFALVFDAMVVQIEVKQFTVHPDLVWVDISDATPTPEVGWTYNGVDFIAPPPPPSPLTDQEKFDKVVNRPEIRALIAGLAEMRDVTPAQVKTWLRNKL